LKRIQEFEISLLLVETTCKVIALVWQAVKRVGSYMRLLEGQRRRRLDGGISLKVLAGLLFNGNYVV